MRAVVLVVLLGAVAQADTLGYMRATPIAYDDLAFWVDVKTGAVTRR